MERLTSAVQAKNWRLVLGLLGQAQNLYLPAIQSLRLEAENLDDVNVTATVKVSREASFMLFLLLILYVC